MKQTACNVTNEIQTILMQHISMVHPHAYRLKRSLQTFSEFWCYMYEERSCVTYYVPVQNAENMLPMFVQDGVILWYTVDTT